MDEIQVDMSPMKKMHVQLKVMEAKHGILDKVDGVELSVHLPTIGLTPDTPDVIQYDEEKHE